MVDKIVYTYKFTTLPNIASLMEECKIWLITILNGFNPEKSKAFSYFSVITKNWFIHKVKDNARQSKTEVIFENINASVEQEHYKLSYTITSDEEQTHSDFFSFLLTEFEDWSEDDTLKENDIKVLNAIRLLFDNSQDIEIFNKKAVYFYLRELTKLTTKQVTNSLTKFKVLYKDFRNDWNNQWYF